MQRKSDTFSRPSDISKLVLGPENEFEAIATGKNRSLPNFVTILENLWNNRFSEIVPKIGILNFQNSSTGLNFNLRNFFGSLS